MQLPEPPKTPLDIAPQVLKGMGDLIPLLDKSQHGWWRLVVLAIVIGGVVAGVSIAIKIEPHKIAPQSDSACRVETDSVVCN
jgi:hypothetical protein